MSQLYTSIFILFTILTWEIVIARVPFEFCPRPRHHPLHPPEWYSAGGTVFDQTGSPDGYLPLPPGNYPGEDPNLSPVTVTVYPNVALVTSYTTFPDSISIDEDFVGTDSIGSFALNYVSPGSSTNNNITQGLPLGPGIVNCTNGEVTRSGFQVYWSAGKLANYYNISDFVIFTASPNGWPNLVIVQVYSPSLPGSGWSDWVYLPPTETFPLTANKSGFVTTYDLTVFGLAPDSMIDAINVVNLDILDRIESPSGEGIVLPNDDGHTKPSYFPVAPTVADYGSVGESTMMPEVLYIAATHELITKPTKSPGLICAPDDEDCTDDSDETGAGHLHAAVGRLGARKKKHHHKKRELQ